MKTQDSLRVTSPGLAEFQASFRSHPWFPCNSHKHKGCNKHGEPPLPSAVWLEKRATRLVPSEDFSQAKAAVQLGWHLWDPACGGPQLEAASGPVFGDGWWLRCTNNCFGLGELKPAALCNLPSRHDWGCGAEEKCLQHSSSLGNVLVVISACTS